MKKEMLNKPEIKLVGLLVRTNNKNEINPRLSKIGELAGRYKADNIADQIFHRKNPGVTLAVYTEYENNEHGEYTYFIGEEVKFFEDFSSNFQKLIIPPSQYLKFSTATGKMPQVVIEGWQKIWNMSSEQLGGRRTYQADFEVYDHRAIDPNNTSLDIYIGIE